MVLLAASGVSAALVVANQAGQQAAPVPASDALHRPLDQILDVNVRDGLVYYRALQSSRGALDRYVASLNVPAATYERLVARSEDGVLGECVQRVRPADGRSPAIRFAARAPPIPPRASGRSPALSIRRSIALPGARVTLDEIDKTILPEFNEPRLALALGRGAVGSGRLRSEAYTASRLDVAARLHPDRSSSTKRTC